MNNGYCTDYTCPNRNPNGDCTITGCIKVQPLNYPVIRSVSLTYECIERIADAVVRKLREDGDDRR